MQISSVATSRAELWNIRQFLFCPTWKHYATSAKDILHLLLINSAGRRRAWNVRLSCSENGVVEVEAQRRRREHARLSYLDTQPTRLKQ